MAYPKSTANESDKPHLKWEDQDKKEGFFYIFDKWFEKITLKLPQCVFFFVLVMFFLNRTKIVIRESLYVWEKLFWPNREWLGFRNTKNSRIFSSWKFLFAKVSALKVQSRLRDLVNQAL